MPLLGCPGDVALSYRLRHVVYHERRIQAVTNRRLEAGEPSSDFALMSIAATALKTWACTWTGRREKLLTK